MRRMDTASSPSLSASSIAADAIRSRYNGPHGPIRGLTVPPPPRSYCHANIVRYTEANDVRTEGGGDDVRERWPRVVEMGRSGRADFAGAAHLDGHHDPAHRHPEDHPRPDADGQPDAVDLGRLRFPVSGTADRDGQSRRPD